jgi:phosphatidate cytidylyltransferase
MKKRLLTAGVLLVILCGAFAFRLIDIYGVYVFDLLIGALSIFAALEFAKILNYMGYPISSMAAGLYPSLMFAGHMFYFLFKLDLYLYVVIQLSALIAAFLLTFLAYIVLNTKEMIKYREKNSMSRFKYAVKISLKTFLTFLYPTTFLLAFMLLNRIDSLPITGIGAFNGYFGWVALILAFLIPIITDSAAMICGGIIKGPKLCPKISPKKTISGAVCGLVFTSLIIGAIYYIFNLFSVIRLGFSQLNIQVYHFVILGFITSILCQIGDIFESYLKRKANIKDSGNIFPGHGGFLDRIDSHIFGAPTVFIFLILLIII